MSITPTSFGLFLLMLLILVLVHEFGHFIAAKLSKVRVDEFGFGLPPRLWGKKVGETLYSINWLPIGGFVKVYGEEYAELNDKEKGPEITDKSRAFAYKSAWKKIFILTAGILGNFLLGWLLISFLFTQGVLTSTNQVIVEKVQTNSPAQAVGIKEKDVIQKIESNGKEYPLTSSNDLIKATKELGDQESTLIVIRGNETKVFTVTPRKNPPKGQGSLGVVITSLTEKKYPWYLAPFYGLVEAFNITANIIIELLRTIAMLLTFQKPQVDVAGPIGILQYTGQAASYGIKAFLELVALLSLNLAVVNILPFPALDGGRLVFVIYEAVTKKKVNQTFERNLNFIGIISLIALAALISINDIVKLMR